MAKIHERIKKKVKHYAKNLGFGVKHSKKNRVNEFAKNPRRALLMLSIPMIAGMFVQVMYNVVDTAYVGRLGTDALAALTFSFPLFFILIAINSGISVGMSSRIARYLGEKNKKAAENVAVHGIIMSILAALVLFLLCFPLLRSILTLFGAEGNVLNLAYIYCTIIFAGGFFMFPVYVLNGVFSSQGDTKTPVKIQVAGLVMNIILDPIFIFAFKMGVAGAAIATVISIMFTLVLSIYYIKRRSYLKIQRKSFSWSLPIFKSIISVGAPSTIMMMLMSFYTIFINNVLSMFGTDHVAAFGIVMRLESVITMPIVAMSIALMTLTGMFYGAKRYDLLKGLIYYGMKISLALVLGIGFFFFVFPMIFLKIFTPDASLIALAIPYLRIDILNFPFIIATLITSRVLQGMGRGMPGMIINVVRVLVVSVPLAYFLVLVMHYSYLAVPVSMLIGGFAASLLAFAWLFFVLRKIGA